MVSIDDEWSKFLMNQNTNGLGFSSISSHTNTNVGSSTSNNVEPTSVMVLTETINDNPLTFAPTCDELYISTKTKVVFLSEPVDIQNIFWQIQVIDYWKPCDGVVKKQMKIVSNTMEEFEEYEKKKQNVSYK